MFLGNLIALGQIQAARLPGLDQLLVLYPKVIDGAYATLRTRTIDGTAPIPASVDAMPQTTMS